MANHCSGHEYNPFLTAMQFNDFVLDASALVEGPAGVHPRVGTRANVRVFALAMFETRRFADVPLALHKAMQDMCGIVLPQLGKHFEADTDPLRLRVVSRLVFFNDRKPPSWTSVLRRCDRLFRKVDAGAFARSRAIWNSTPADKLAAELARPAPLETAALEVLEVLNRRIDAHIQSHASGRLRDEVEMYMRVLLYVAKDVRDEESLLQNKLVVVQYCQIRDAAASNTRLISIDEVRALARAGFKALGCNGMAAVI